MSPSSPKLHSRAAEKPEAFPQTFARPADRALLTPTALKAIRSLATAWRAAMALRSGGVGYYPEANFIHVDTGPVRYW